jgi:hypothetical protein
MKYSFKEKDWDQCSLSKKLLKNISDTLKFPEKFLLISSRLNIKKLKYLRAIDKLNILENIRRDND